MPEPRFLPDEAATLSLGRELGERFGRGGLIYLHGELGAGKTTLVRGLVTSLGWKGSVRSPSYALVHEYPVTPPVRHLDLYRLGSLDEALSLDLDALFVSGLSLVEWPEVLGDAFTPSLEVFLETSGDGRSVRFRS